MNNSFSADLSRSMRSDAGVPDIDESRFEILEEIGVGGMGSVYRAVQRSVGRFVAVKMLLPEHASNASGLARFVREANVIARLTHPNIVQLIDFGRDTQGNLLLVMELLEGEPLRTLLRREGRLAPERAVVIAAQCLQALRTAHAAGVIHRDLKPENIFVHRTDDGDHVKVLDFGVAKLTEAEAGDPNHTAQGSMVGTLRYMAPEQVAGDAPDQRIDVYAMGVTLYEMLSGALPYDGRDRFVLLRQIIAEPPIPLLARAPDVPAALADVVMRAIAKLPSERFANVEEFRRALLPLGGEMSRWMVSSDGSGRFGASGSGVVPAGAMTSTGRVSPDPTSTPIAHSEVLRAAMHSATNSSPGFPTAPAPRRSPLVAVLVALGLIALGLGAAVLLRAPAAPIVPAAAAPPSTSPTTVLAPVVAPAPAAAARMVVVQTTPAGARITEASGVELCAATPCAVSVPVGGTRPVVLTLGATRLPVVLDGNSASASVDLAPVAAPTPPAAAPANSRPSNGGGRTHVRRPAPEPGGDLPMFLPH
ncbi:MAG: serine/threonine-protein kinase [Deltaproteobacteria bacterium]|nr:serine/threonine-protein kinase [Myxococcales bacterium]MDP3218037.1 serine/threonine-protein kinase [Deltaproteobacteria bacterium]